MRWGHSFADTFYASHEWRRCRQAYLRSVGGLCERCAKKGLIVAADHVHHKVKLTPENISDPNVTYNWDNLEALCTECHREEHCRKRWFCGADGSVRIVR